VKIGTRVRQARDETQASRVERLKERLLRERADDIQIQIGRARRENMASEVTVAPGQRR
jgi:hypothetical protein